MLGLSFFAFCLEMQIPKNFNANPFSYHEEIELRIETLTNLGVGLGRINNWVVMVPFALPGEIVRARIYRNFKNYSDADLVEVIEASPHRIIPKCHLFGICGGCQYQNFEYSQQLLWKQKQIQETFQRLAEVTIEVNPTVASPKEYFYRSKITPHFPKPNSNETFPIGFLKNGGRNQIVDVSQCLIATEGINQALPTEREKVISSRKRFKKGGTLLLRDVREGVISDNNAIVSEKVGKLDFQFLAGEFFQNNPFILPLMVEYILSQASEEGIHYLIDAYCGVGLFALSAAESFKKVMGIEVNPLAVKWAEKNAANNNIQNCDFVIGQAENIFEKVTFPAGETVVIIDPPRKGCDQEFINQIVSFGPKKIIYISCEPSTQARDIKSLLSLGYGFIAAQPFDLFPQTRHIENVVILVKF